MNLATGLPEVDEEKCVACGACAKACPKIVIEIRKKNAAKTPALKRVWVSCINKDKGGVARKACASACIGCGKCQKTCKFDAITIENNLAYIDPEKCKACGMCVAECPTGAIHCTAAVQTIVEKLKAKKAADAAKAKEEAAKKAAEALAAKKAAEEAAAKAAETAAKAAETVVEKVEETAAKVVETAAKVEAPAPKAHKAE
jgi:ferredoxin